MSVQSGGRIRLSKLNDQLTCKLCHGYFIDATTIIECLHSFCKSCIVKYLETTKYCPICEVQVHKSKPLLNIRPDHTLQDIVYKLVPGCYQNEMRCRREFYEMHPEAQLSNMSPEARGEPIESHIYSLDESLSLSLEYYNPSLNDNTILAIDDSKESSLVPSTTSAALTLPSTQMQITTNPAALLTSITTTSPTSTSTSITTTGGKILPKRYLRCPAAVTVFHLQKLIRAKYGLSNAHRVDVMYKEESLCENYTLMDVMYIYHWRRKVPLHLSYRIFESSPKRLKLSEDNVQFKESLTSAGISSLEPKERNVKREWKEVQLKISETGIMSVTGITSPESKKVLASESLEDEQRRLDESVAAAVMMPDKKSTNNTNESASPVILDVNTKNYSGQQQQQLSQQSNEKPNDSQVETRKNINAKSATEVKQISTNSNKSSNNFNNSNNTTNSSSTSRSSNYNSNSSSSSSSSSNSNNTSDESRLNVDSREKQKGSLGNDMKTYQSPSGTGSKIDALSVKLQFQPKVGQVNNTYSKKTPKEKTVLEKALKKSDNRNLFKDGQMEMKNFSDKNRAIIRTPVCTSSKSSTNFQSKLTVSQTQCTTVDLPSNAISSSYSTISTPSVSISITSQKNSSPDHNRESSDGGSQLSSGNSYKCRKSSGENVESSNQRMISNRIRNTSSHSTGGKSCFSRQNNSPSINSESLANIGLNISTALVGVGSSGSPSFPYTVQDLVNNAMLKSPSKHLTNTCGQKQNIIGNVSVSSTSHQTISANSSNSPFNLQTPSMSVYSMPNMTKNNTSCSSSGTNNSVKGNPKVNLEITTVYSAPPCPDAIPISMMKPTIRKNEITAKGTNINDICAKIGTSGSKINDICAKIGENSKEKNKIDTRSRPEIPDLLKITKKTMPSVSVNENIGMKHIPNIPNVPIYTPTNNVPTSDSKGMYMNKDMSKMTMTPTTAVATAMSSGITITNITASTTTVTTIVTTITSTNTTSSLSTISSIQSTSTPTSLEPTSISGSSVPFPSSTISNSTITTITPSTSTFHQSSIRGNSMKRSQSQTVGYKTLRDPPKSWNPTLSKNNYVAAKNQAKEQQNQLQPSSLMSESGGGGGDGNSSGKNSITSKPAKIFKMRNTPRYLGNPASGVKPMYGSTNEVKDNKDQSVTSKNNATTGLSMTKIDPKTLSPIVSTNTNSPIVSPPPYSSNARSYQNTPFSRSGNSPLSPRNSPVNMLSTNPFIPSPTPNTNPRLIYSHFIPFPDSSRFNNPLIRTSIGIPPPSAFHSSLPPSINKFYRSSCMPQTTCTTFTQQQGLPTQPTSIQKIQTSPHSTSTPSSLTSTITSTTASMAITTSPLLMSSVSITITTTAPTNTTATPLSTTTTTTISTLTTVNSTIATATAATSTATNLMSSTSLASSPSSSSSVPTSSSSTSSPKSPKTSAASSMSNLTKKDPQTSNLSSMNITTNQIEQNPNAFNLSKMTSTSVNQQSNFVSDLSKIATSNATKDGESLNQSDNYDRSEDSEKNEVEELNDGDSKKNVNSKNKNRLDDNSRLNSDDKEHKLDRKEKPGEKDLKKNKKNKRKEKIILKEINIKRPSRDSHCILSSDSKNLLPKGSNNELQTPRGTDNNCIDNATNNDQKLISNEVVNTHLQNFNTSNLRSATSNQHQTITGDENPSSEFEDKNTTIPTNSSTDGFTKSAGDNSNDTNTKCEEPRKTEQESQAKISEIQMNKAES